jgi:hypothetical protein
MPMRTTLFDRLPCLSLLSALALTMSGFASTTIYDNGAPNHAYGANVGPHHQGNDFQLSSPSSITSMHIWTGEGGVWDGTLDWWILDDAGGLPGNVMASGAGQNIVKTPTGLIVWSGLTEYEYDFEVTGVPVLEAGTTYWLVLHLSSDFDDDQIAWETSGSGGNGVSSPPGVFGGWSVNGQENAFTLSFDPCEPPVLPALPAGGDLGCNPAVLPACVEGLVATTSDGPVPVVCTAGDVVIDGRQRSQTFTYTATDPCGISASDTVTYTWRVSNQIHVNVFDNGAPNHEFGANVGPHHQGNDFQLSSPSSITSMHIWTGEGGVWDGTLDWWILDDAGGLPGNVVASGAGQNIVKTPTGLTVWSGLTEYEYDFEVAGVPVLEVGRTYWLVLHLSSDFDDDQIAWETSGFGGNGVSSPVGVFGGWYVNTQENAFTLSFDGLEAPVLPELPAGGDLGCNPAVLPACVEGLVATTSDGPVPVLCQAHPIISGKNCGKRQSFTYTATDICGNVASQLVHYSWKVTPPPMISGVPTDPKPIQCGAPLIFKTPTATASCGETVTLTYEDTVSGTCPVVHVRTWTALDSCGSTSTASQTFIVVDTTPPVLPKVPAGKNLGCNPTSLPVCTDGLVATDNCGPVPVICEAGPISIGIDCQRTQLFTYSATDACGNKVKRTEKYVWRVDTAPPVLPELPAGGDLGCNPVPPRCVEGLVAEDDCGPVPVMCIAGEVLMDRCRRSQTFTYTATDLCGNTVSATVSYSWGVSGSGSTLAWDNGVPNYDHYYAPNIGDYFQANQFQLSSPSSIGGAHIWTAEGSPWDGTIEWMIFSDAGGRPGSPIASGTGQNINRIATGRDIMGGYPEYEYDFELAGVPILATGTTYWFGIHLSSGFNGDLMGWETSGGSGYGASSYLGLFDNWVIHPWEYAFYLRTPVGPFCDPLAVTITGPASDAVFPVNTPVALTGSFTPENGPHSAQWTIQGNSFAGTLDETSKTVTDTVSFSSPGVYSVGLSVADACGNTGSANTVGGLPARIVIIEPTSAAGFANGVGGIASPEGAYIPNPSLTGPASFRFAVKYNNGSSLPSGTTSFKFQRAKLDFKGTSFDWLVVTGATAQCRGTGTLDGVSGYNFLWTALDGDLPGGGGVDKFRIKIWTATGVVYDNQLGEDDTAAPTTPLSNGTIIIHE